ncbi:MAG: hypothetical protein ABII72_02145 [Parcubacteria group bacterium]
MGWEIRILVVYLVVFTVVGLSFVLRSDISQIAWPLVTNVGLIFLAWSAWRKRKRKDCSEYFDMTLVGETLISTGIMFVMLGLGVSFAVFMKEGQLTFQNATYFVRPAFEGLISSGISYGLTTLLRNKEVRLLEQERGDGRRLGGGGLEVLRDTAIGAELAAVIENLRAAGEASKGLKTVLDENAKEHKEVLRQLSALYKAAGLLTENFQRFFGDSFRGPGGGSSGGGLHA